jgi:hypothetical protein
MYPTSASRPVRAIRANNDKVRRIAVETPARTIIATVILVECAAARELLAKGN